MKRTTELTWYERNWSCETKVTVMIYLLACSALVTSTESAEVDVETLQTCCRSLFPLFPLLAPLSLLLAHAYLGKEAARSTNAIPAGTSGGDEDRRKAAHSTAAIPN